MIKNLIYILTLTLGIKVCNAQVIHKMYVGSGNSGQFKLNIIPVTYDSTLTDSQILVYVDSLPAGFLHAKMYNLLYKDDNTRLAIQVTEGTYLFHIRYTITEYYKNGNIKRVAYFSKHLKRYWTFGYYADASPQFTGKYRHDLKKGKWRYFNADGNLVKVECYSSAGVLRASKDYNPPKRTLTTIFNPKHPKGQPYIIQ